MPTALRLIAATSDMRELLTASLAEHGIAFSSRGEIVTVENSFGSEGGPERVLGMLRQILSAPEREAVSVVEGLAFPDEFPVTTRLEAWWSVFETVWFERAMAANAFSIWYQPVVDTMARRTIGHECLIRLTKGRRREGAEIMAAAASRRDLRGFDSFTRQLAIRSVAAQWGGNNIRSSMCFVNFIPSAIYRPAYCIRPMIEVLHATGIPAGNVVMEAVECNRNPDIEHLRRIREYLREQGLGFALDDVEANSNTIRMLCELSPDYIKLEKRLVHRIEQPREAVAIRKIVEVAERLHVRVIAKGVERVSTMEHLWMAGVECMQGYLFGSPAPNMAGTEMDLAHMARAIEPSPDGSGYAPSPDGSGYAPAANYDNADLVTV